MREEDWHKNVETLAKSKSSGNEPNTVWPRRGNSISVTITFSLENVLITADVWPKIKSKASLCPIIGLRFATGIKKRQLNFIDVRFININMKWHFYNSIIVN